MSTALKARAKSANDGTYAIRVRGATKKRVDTFAAGLRLTIVDLMEIAMDVLESTPREKLYEFIDKNASAQSA